MMTWAPVEYAVRRSLGRRRTLEEMASRSWTVAPGRTQVVPRAVYLEETLSRATGAGQFSDLPDQLRLISGRTVTHQATRAHALSRAALVGSSVYVREHRMPLAPDGGFRARDLLESTHVRRGALGCTYFGNLFFGHYWTDDVPLMQLGSELAEVVRPARPMTGQQRDILDLLGLDVRASSSVTFDELLVFDDVGQNDGKVGRYRQIRARFAERYLGDAPPRGVYLLRGSSGSPRLLVNEREIVDALAPHGVVVVDPERHSLDALSRATAGASLVIGVEGSQLLHGFYTAAEGARFLALQPPNRLSNILKSYTDCLGMHYGFVVGEPARGGFRVRLDEVLRVIDLLEARAARAA